MKRMMLHTLVLLATLLLMGLTTAVVSAQDAEDAAERAEAMTREAVGELSGEDEVAEAELTISCDVFPTRTGFLFICDVTDGVAVTCHGGVDFVTGLGEVTCEPA